MLGLLDFSKLAISLHLNVIWLTWCNLSFPEALSNCELQKGVLSNRKKYHFAKSIEIFSEFTLEISDCNLFLGVHNKILILKKGHITTSIQLQAVQIS